MSVSPVAVPPPAAPARAPATGTSSISSFGGGSIEQRDGRIVVRGGSTNDNIRLTRLEDGRVRLHMNGATRIFSADEAKRLSVAGGNGNDRLFTDGFDGVSVSGGKGNDSIESRGARARLLGGDGNDRLRVRGDRADVDGGRGNDGVSTSGAGTRVRTGLGKDRVRVRGDGARVNADGGNDTVRVSGNRARVHAGQGRDDVRVFGDDAKVRGGREKLPARQEKTTETVTLTGGWRGNGAGGIEVERPVGGGWRGTGGAADHKPARDRRDDDRVYVRGDRASIYGGAGNDGLRARGEHARVRAGNGNDRVAVRGNDSRIRGNRGQDTAEVVGERGRAAGVENSRVMHGASAHARSMEPRSPPSTPAEASQSLPVWWSID